MRSPKEILLLSFFLMTCDECNAGLTDYVADKFKKIRLNANNYTTEEKEEDDLNNFKYPGNNIIALEAVQKMWQNYYDCLKQRASEERKPEIRRLLEGQYTEFHCDICQRPFDNFQHLQWKYKPYFSETNKTELEQLDLAPEMLLMSNKTLKIFNAIEEFAGIYVCYYASNPISVYLLEVSKNDTIEKVPVSDLLQENVVNVGKIKLQIGYKWSSWTECSSCGIVGRKFKYGTCTVSIKKRKEAKIIRQIIIFKREIAANSTKRTLNESRALQFFKKIIPKGKFKGGNPTTENYENLDFEVEIIERFETGIPCLSPILPKRILGSIGNINKTAKAIVNYCSVPCPEVEIFEALDKFGRILEIANNSAGIYSAFQKLPDLPPEIERTSVVAEFGTEIIIQCPGTMLADIPITWKINKKVIFPDVIANESNGRFTIDLVNRIHLKKLRLKDSHLYSCWQRDKLAGTVHLNVEKKFKIGFDHHVTLFGIAAVIGTFLLVGVKMLTRQLKTRKK